MGCYCYKFFRLSSDFKSDSIRNSVVSFFFLFGRSGRHSFTDGPSRIGAGERVTKPRFHMRRPIKHRPSIKKKNTEKDYTQNRCSSQVLPAVTLRFCVRFCFQFRTKPIRFQFPLPPRVLLFFFNMIHSWKKKKWNANERFRVVCGVNHWSHWRHARPNPTDFVPRRRSFSFAVYLVFFYLV